MQYAHKQVEHCDALFQSRCMHTAKQASCFGFLAHKNPLSCYAHRSIRYCTNKGTGRPVAARSVLPNMMAAVPATSKWAQRNFFVNLDRKQAAVMVPAERPPVFAISAKGLLICS